MLVMIENHFGSSTRRNESTSEIESCENASQGKNSMCGKMKTTSNTKRTQLQLHPSYPSPSSYSSAMSTDTPMLRVQIVRSLG